MIVSRTFSTALAVAALCSVVGTTSVANAAVSKAPEAKAAVTQTSGTKASAAKAPVRHPEIVVSAQTGVGQRAFVVRNQGNTTVPANTQFTFHSNRAVGIGLFGDPQIQEDWAIGVLGSGYDGNVYLKEPLLPGQSKTFKLSTVEVSAFSQWSFELSDPRTSSLDTNYANNSAGIRCALVVLGLPACSVA
ncbi:MAG: hypothetical protein PGN15_09310 [Aeromicrobium erythreum]